MKSHPDTLLSLDDVANLYRMMGELEKALPVYQRVLEIELDLTGQNDPDYARSLNNVAVPVASQGEYATAEPAYRQALATSEPSWMVRQASCCATP